MYELDMNTCTAIDVIQRSVTCHPSLLREAVENSRDEDFAYWATREPGSKIRQAVSARHMACQRALDILDRDDIELDMFKYDMGAGIIVLNLACKLQCLPAHARTASALRTWPEG
jgi:hypothetical protein